MSENMVYLRWLDSAITLEWARVDEECDGLTEIETIGYLILEDDNHVRIAQSCYVDEKYGAILSIPKSVILERQVLRKPQKVRP